MTSATARPLFAFAASNEQERPVKTSHQQAVYKFLHDAEHLDKMHEAASVQERRSVHHVRRMRASFD